MAGLFVFIPLAPALSALVLILFGGRLSRRVIAIQACSAVLASFVLSLLSFAALTRSAAGAAPVVRTLGDWVVSGAFRASIALRFDPLTAVMVLVVTGVGALIHIYSVGYMADDRSLARYFAQLNLFTFAMLVLVMSSNLVLMFVGWEGVGLCSYLLIGFWFERPAAARAGQKAFIVNRVGDAAFIVGLLLILTSVGGAEFDEIGRAVGDGRLPTGLVTAIALLLFAGACGKSAQIPLHVWLPDAMEGPTPVSALIHAATMVTAGVFMVCRLSPLYAASGAALEVVAWVGAATALTAAATALVQTDIKRVLAFSTISQIGYMFIGCGVGAYGAAMFHLMTHAFFKSLLFLAAGSVIHALAGEQDMRRMGGLRRLLPRTYPAFLTGALAIAGVPFLSGFFSKDAILSRVFAQGRYGLWSFGLFGAVLTAFYIFRLIFLTFFGESRLPEEARAHVHESPRVMTGPLIILAGLAIVGGYVGLPAFFGRGLDVFSRFLSPALAAGAEGAASARGEGIVLGFSVVAAAVGISAAYLFYQKKPAIPGALARRFPGFHRMLGQNFYFDLAYDAVLVKPLLRGAEAIYESFDVPVVDGALNGSARAAAFLGRGLSLAETGWLKDYALIMLAGLVLVVGLLL